MALNPNLLNTNPVVASATTKKEKAAVNPIASRDWKQIPFVREAAPEVDDSRLQLAIAWDKNPELCIISMLVSGLTVKEIVKHIGWKADNKKWLKSFRSAQRMIKYRLCEQFLTEPVTVLEKGKPVIDHVSICPTQYFIPHVNSDGVEVQIDVAAKLKRATYNAMWNPASKDQKTGKPIQAGSLVFSIAKGRPFCFKVDGDNDPIRPFMWEVYEGWDRPLWLKTKLGMETEYNKIFNPTRGTEMPPELAKYLASSKAKADAEAMRGDSAE